MKRGLLTVITSVIIGSVVLVGAYSFVNYYINKEPAQSMAEKAVKVTNAPAKSEAVPNKLTVYTHIHNMANTMVIANEVWAEEPVTKKLLQN